MLATIAQAASDNVITKDEARDNPSAVGRIESVHRGLRPFGGRR